MKFVPRSLLALAVTALCAPALAYEAGDVILRFGPALAGPDDSSDSTLGEIAEVESGVSLGISGTWMLNSSVGVELLGSLPFEHDIVGDGALDGVDIGSTRHLPPTLLVNYYPAVSDTFQPFFGAGVNYTSFFSEDTSSELDAALGGDSDIALKDSTGLALELGVDVALNDSLMFNFTVWNIEIDTEATVKANGAKAVDVDVEIDPRVYMAGLAMKF